MRILIIDQLPATGKGVSAILERERPMHTLLDQAYTMEAGCREAKALHPDLILMEPLLFGLAPQNMLFQLSEFRKLCPDSRLVAVTASCEGEHIRTALKCGFSDYLYKPINRPDFLSMLDRCAGESERLYLFPDVSLEQDLVSAVHRGEEEAAEAALQRIIDGRQAEEPYSRWCVRCMEIATRILHTPNEVAQVPENLSLLYQEFIRSSTTGNAFADLDAAMRDFVSGCARCFDQHTADQSYQIIQRAMQIVDEHMDEDLSLSRVAGELYISTTYFSRLFRTKTGKKFSDYLAEHRIERAKLLLATTDAPVTSVARQVGYPDANSFARLFKGRTGLTPSRYRQNSRPG